MKNIIEEVLRWMDGLFGQALPIGVPPGSTLQMVFRMDPLYSVEKTLVLLGWILFGEPEELPADVSSSWLLLRKVFLKRSSKEGGRTVGVFITLLLAPLFVLFLGLLGVLLYTFTHFEETLEGGIQLWPAACPWVLAACVALVLFFCLLGAALLAEYLVREWERRHIVVAVYDSSLFVGGVPILGAPWLSVSATQLVEEPKLGPAGEKVATQAPTLLGRWWDSFLWRRLHQNLGLLFLPVRVYRGEDKLDFVGFAATTLICIQRVAAISRQAGDLGSALAKKLNETIYLNPEGRGALSVQVEGEEERALREMFAQRLLAIAGAPPLGEDWVIVNLMKVEDPGLWDRKTGFPISQVTTPKPPPSFPRA